MQEHVEGGQAEEAVLPALPEHRRVQAQVLQHVQEAQVLRAGPHAHDERRLRVLRWGAHHGAIHVDPELRVLQASPMSLLAPINAGIHGQRNAGNVYGVAASVTSENDVMFVLATLRETSCLGH